MTLDIDQLKRVAEENQRLKKIISLLLDEFEVDEIDGGSSYAAKLCCEARAHIKELNPQPKGERV